MSGRLYELSFAKTEQLLRQLAAAGLTPDDVNAILRDKSLASWWVEQLSQRTQALAPLSRLGTPAMVYDNFVARAAERDWPFTAEQLQELHDAMPVDHVSQLSNLLALDIWLGDLSYTFDEHWKWHKTVMPSTLEVGDLNPGRLKLVDPDRYGDRPSVRWVELNLISYPGLSPSSPGLEDVAPGLSLVAMSGLYPAIGRSIGFGDNPAVVPGVPSFWLASLQAADEDGHFDGRFNYAPAFDAGYMQFSPMSSHFCSKHRSVPTFHDL